jgi:ABC-type transporter MlaC component
MVKRDRALSGKQLPSKPFLEFLQNNRVKMRHFFSAGLILVFLILSWNSGAASAKEMTDSAQIFVKKLANKLFKKLVSPNIYKELRKLRLRVMLRNSFAVKTIGIWVLGRHVRKAKPTQIQEYFTLFKNLIVETYAVQFTKPSGINLFIKEVAPKGKKITIVYSELKDSAGTKKASVEWRLRNKNRLQDYTQSPYA